MSWRKPRVLEGGAAQLVPKKGSGTYPKTTLWEAKDEVVLRHEAELRYRDRSPPRSEETVNPRDRVTLEELWVWSLENLGKLPPRTAVWEEQFFEWFDLMVERNPVHLAYLDEYALCGAKGEMPPLRTEVESEVTCPMCRAAFGDPLNELPS